MLELIISFSINYTFFIIILNFLFFTNLFAEFFKCRFFSIKLPENVCAQGEITETNN